MKAQKPKLGNTVFYPHGLGQIDCLSPNDCGTGPQHALLHRRLQASSAFDIGIVAVLSGLSLTLLPVLC